MGGVADHLFPGHQDLRGLADAVTKEILRR
jgi:hypothetical protein